MFCCTDQRGESGVGEKGMIGGGLRRGEKVEEERRKMRRGRGWGIQRWRQGGMRMVES